MQEPSKSRDTTDELSAKFDAVVAKEQMGFTVIELLVVIVVIAILALITTVGYKGM